MGCPGSRRRPCTITLGRFPREDCDSDGKHDSLDMAMYVLGVGQELLDLQSLRQVLTTRVDTVLLVRTRYSSDGTRVHRPAPR